MEFAVPKQRTGWHEREVSNGGRLPGEACPCNKSLDGGIPEPMEVPVGEDADRIPAQL